MHYTFKISFFQWLHAFKYFWWKKTIAEHEELRSRIKSKSFVGNLISITKYLFWKNIIFTKMNILQCLYWCLCMYLITSTFSLMSIYISQNQIWNLNYKSLGFLRTINLGRRMKWRVWRCIGKKAFITGWTVYSTIISWSYHRKFITA